MQINVGKEVAALQRMAAKDLRVKYAEVFNEPTSSGNKAWLVKRIAWRLQAIAEGGLSERARQRAAELANDADIRLTPPKLKAETAADAKTTTAAIPVQEDDRLPPPGSLITRVYKGKTLHVKILSEGFEFEGEVYKSLSAVAKTITGSHCNGFLFFRLGKDGAK